VVRVVMEILVKEKEGKQKKGGCSELVFGMLILSVCV